MQAEAEAESIEQMDDLNEVNTVEQVVSDPEEMNETWVLSDDSASDVWDLDQTLILGDEVIPQWSDSDSVNSDCDMCNMSFETDVPHDNFNFYF